MRELEGATQESVAKKYGVSTSQVSRLSKNKQDLIHEFESGGNHERKRRRGSKEEDVGDALFLWFEHKLGQGACLSGPLLKQKACDLACTQGTDFSPSDGWLSCWKARHNIVKSMERSRTRTSP